MVYAAGKDFQRCDFFKKPPPTKKLLMQATHLKERICSFSVALVKNYMMV